jgi:hypothetical protein
MIYLQNQLPKTGRHPLSHFFMERGHHKKIMDDHDKLCSEIKISQLFLNNRFFQHRYKFQKYITDVHTIFLAVISTKEFFFSLSE